VALDSSAVCALAFATGHSPELAVEDKKQRKAREARER